MEGDDRNDALEQIDDELDALLEPARVIPPVADARRQAIRQRVESTTGALAGPSPSRTRWVFALAAVVAAAALLWWIAGATPLDATGSLDTAGERITVATGDRATVVVEPLGSLRWAIEGGEAAIEQPRGRAFYRVEPGGSYVVQTPHAEVRVTGTSFEVEVVMSNNSHRLRYMGIGAAVAAATVVTVYEGRVVLANDEGKTVVEAGQRAIATPGEAPSAPLSRVAGEVDAPQAAAAGAAEPSSGARESVLVSDLRARVRDLEEELDRVREKNEEHEAERTETRAQQVQSIYDPTPEQLLEAAENCGMSYASPMRPQGEDYLGPEDVKALGVTPKQLEAITASLDREQAEWIERLRDLYIDATGDEAGAGSLSERAMRAELIDKADDADLERARTAVARERAGLAEPAPDAESEPLVRYYRGEVARTRRVFEAVTGIMGDEQAAYEALAHMPSSVHQHNGCD